jgi:hypothetical protein
MTKINSRFPGALLIALGAALDGAAGCCGVGTAPGYTGLNDAGAVQFTAVVGSSQTLMIPVQDTANTDETINGAGVSGSGAAEFKVLSAFPIAVPAGAPVNVQVQFTAEAPGEVSATLVLQTAGMGDSKIPLDGLGTPAAR